MSKHINELYYTILYSILTWILTSIIIYNKIEIIISWYIKYLNIDISLIYIQISEAFIIYIKLSLLWGFYGTLFIIILLNFLYIRSALYKYEEYNIKKFVIIFIFLIIPMINIIIQPLFLKYLILYFSSFQNSYYNLTLMQNIQDFYNLIYNSTILLYLFSFTPLIFYYLSQLNIIQLSSIKNIRKYIHFSLLILSALITPPDIITLIIICIPLSILFEFTLLISYLIFTIKNNK